jgi:murein DD-endopeptidase MepM/ murein hydrolase activator NlpD
MMFLTTSKEFFTFKTKVLILLFFTLYLSGCLLQPRRRVVKSGSPYGIAQDGAAPYRQGPYMKLGALARLRGRLSWPVSSRKVNSKFGWRGARFHEGVDLKGSKGDSIFAVHPGRVVFSGVMGDYGNVVILKSGRFATLYAHNTRNLVREGVEVRQGEELAIVGQTGRATGPHLHFEIRLRDSLNRYVAVDPLFFLRRYG